MRVTGVTLLAALTLVAIGISVALVRGSSHDVMLRGERS